MQHDLSAQKIAPSGKGGKTGNKTIAMESGRSFYRRLFFIHWRNNYIHIHHKNSVSRPNYIYDFELFCGHHSYSLIVIADQNAKQRGRSCVQTMNSPQKVSSLY